MAAKGNKRVARAAERSAEKALKEERLALAAITKVMLLECPDPGRVLSRLEAMARSAEGNPRTPLATRKMLQDGVKFVRTAIQRENGKPQALFDPHVGHVKAEKVDELVEGTDGAQQLGLTGQDSFLGDVEVAHTERVDTITKVHGAIVELIREHGPLSDAELFDRYVVRSHDVGVSWPMQSRKAIAERRKELSGAGRLTGAGGTPPKFELVERAVA